MVGLMRMLQGSSKWLAKHLIEASQLQMGVPVYGPEINAHDHEHV